MRQFQWKHLLASFWIHVCSGGDLISWLLGDITEEDYRTGKEFADNREDANGNVFYILISHPDAELFHAT